MEEAAAHGEAQPGQSESRTLEDIPTSTGVAVASTAVIGAGFGAEFGVLEENPVIGITRFMLEGLISLHPLLVLFYIMVIRGFRAKSI